MNTQIEVKAEIHPSEDPEKVVEAVKNIFPDMDLKITDNEVKGRTRNIKSLENFKNKLGLQAIRDSTRSLMKRRKENNKIHLLLNKQPATVDKISFSDGETPLGPIEVTIKSEKISELIDYLAPSKKQR
ncbi:hypothetical protein AKJ65_02910 [candidate division MSBL1 archaeon SCGC-AAA259E19]|uniref:UPF0201 protein AKJ65_02910 n=1 Tax=candidate division MSBL1 archaeon SCGC-AAA259E19 TaxID=1698264 RepID=A0A133UL66_9EURY|nr:hypothetical protein AKJ65_02910 [candidate division MSBL1 archaeon SCGC-AAA259E19]